MSKKPLLEPASYYKFGPLFEKGALCTFSRTLKNMSFDYGDIRDTLANRKDFLGALGLSWQELVCARQAHGDGIACVTFKDKGRGAFSGAGAIADIDALVTSEKGLALGIFTADCLSIFLYDPQIPAIGLVHAGWQGSQKGIASKAVEAMKKEFNCRPQDLCAGFGPSIRSCCYEVGGRMNDYFKTGILERDKRYYLDLVKINAAQLKEAGVREARIVDSMLCTSCRSEEFFSYRRQGQDAGRTISVAMLR
ncbi:MAG: peptidoglycan editing factor PgeF [Candidatus Omnitrophota bacterium]